MHYLKYSIKFHCFTYLFARKIKDTYGLSMMLCCHSNIVMKSSFTFSPCGRLKSIFVNYAEFTD